jgi:hypothetical protein
MALALLPQAAAAGQPKKIYAHHMGALYAGSGAMAHHARHLHDDLGDPGSSNGGEFRNMALAPADREMSIEESADLDIRRALRIGIDGFAINAWAGGEQAKAYLHALFKVAEQRNYPFEITISLDPTCLAPSSNPGPYGPVYQAQVDAVQYLLHHHGGSPKLARRGGRPLIMGYQSVWLGLYYAEHVTGHSMHWTDRNLRATPEAWHRIGQAYREFKRLVGHDFYFQFDMAGFFHGAATDGIDQPMAAAAAVIGHYVEAIGQFLPDGQTESLTAATQQVPAEWTAPLYMHYDNSRGSVSHGGPGTSMLQKLWQAARDSGSSLIQYTTWSDFNENTNLAPGWDTRYAYYDLSAYFIKWWKEGRAPSVDRDRVYLFSRKYPADAAVAPFQGGAYHEGCIEVTTLLTAPATVRVPGRGEYQAPAGLHTMQFPVVPGRVIAEIIRGGQTVISIESPDPVSDRPWRRDHGIVGFSTECERLWSEDFPGTPFPQWSEYGDNDGDGLPNWYEMLHFGRFGDIRTATNAHANEDSDGDGRSNLQEFQTRTNPRNGGHFSDTIPWTPPSIDGGSTPPIGRDDGSSGVVLGEVYRLEAIDDRTPNLVNVSSRAFVRPGDDALIVGFIIEGTRPQEVLIRAVGPSLAQYGIRRPLRDPSLELFSGSERIAANDDWQSDASSSRIGSSWLRPEHEREAAMVVTLAPGVYTAVIRGVVKP